MMSHYIKFINTATDNREPILNGTDAVSNSTEQRVLDTFPNKMDKISVKGNDENAGDNSNQKEQYRDRYFLEAKYDIISSSSASVMSTEQNEVALQAVKSQVNVGDNFNQREIKENHLIETEEAKIPPHSNSGISLTETEPLQGVKEEDNHRVEDGKVIPLSYNNNMLSTETEQQMLSLSVKKNNENSFSQEEHKEDNLRAEKAKIISPSSSSNTLTNEAKKVESQAVIEDSFNEQNVNKEDTGDYPIGEEETGTVEQKGVEESAVNSLSQNEMV